MRIASSMQKFAPESMVRRWSRLAMVWALYYLVIFTLGRDPRYMQKIIWLGAALVGLFTVPLFLRQIRFRHLPREGILLGCFLLWGLTGVFAATDMALYARYLQLMVELAMIVIFVSVILKYSGGEKWFYLAYLMAAVAGIFFGEEPISMGQLTLRTHGRIEGANALGFNWALGFFGMFALFGETKSLWLRAVLSGGGILSLYGVVLSASRCALASSVVIALLWPSLCLVGGSRFKLKVLIGTAMFLLLAYWTFQLIIQKTYMGVRFTQSIYLEDGSTQTRLELVFIGLQIFAENPIFGYGLGQFGDASGTGYYAHNEFIEIAATTGLPGLFLYYAVYVVAWRRLSSSLRYLHDPLIRYRINIARMALLVLLIAGLLARPNFLSPNTMFLLGVAVGVAHWAERMARMACRCPRPGPEPAKLPPPGFPGRRPSSGLGNQRARAFSAGNFH